jgi:hypothetical protein
VFYGVMGIEEHVGKLKDPLLQGYWAADLNSKDPNDQLLCPNFSITFKNQKI